MDGAATTTSAAAPQASATTSRPPVPPAPAASPRLAFAGVFVACMLGFLAVGAVLPVLPRYVRGPLGSSDVAVGVVIGAFALAAIVTRPVAGRVADARGRRTVVVLGTLALGVAGALYSLPFGVGGLLVARLVLGVGEGLVFTAGTAWVVDLAPVERRGQIIGLFGLSIWTGLALGPAIGEAVLSLGGYSAVWAFAALAPLIGAMVATRIPEVRGFRGGFQRRTLLPAAALRPGSALAMAAVGNAAISAFIVLHLASRGGHGTLVFVLFAAAVVGSRLLGSRVPDRLGGRRSASVAACTEAVGLVIIALAGHWTLAAVGAMLVGAGWSMLFPSLALMVVTGAGEQRRAEALGTYTAFFDLGFGLGAPLIGAVASVAGYPAAFWVAAAFAVAGGLVTATAPLRVRALVLPSPGADESWGGA
jgi:MFS family permease